MAGRLTGNDGVDVARAANGLFRGFTTRMTEAVRKDAIMITTGSQKVDELLQGGIESGSVTEVYGEFRNGEDAVDAHARGDVSVADRTRRRRGEGVCTSHRGDVQPQRLIQIAERFGMDPGPLDNVARKAAAKYTEHQSEPWSPPSVMMAESRFALMIIYPVTNLYRTEYEGRGELSARQMHWEIFTAVGGWRMNSASPSSSPTKSSPIPRVSVRVARTRKPTVGTSWRTRARRAWRFARGAEKTES